jgi:GR25 family glycosyltransferase involved in LPS biosynthesis
MNQNLLNYIETYKFIKIRVTNNVSSKINEKVKQIYVINLYEDVLKRNYITKLFEKYNFNYSLIIVDRIKDEDYENLCPLKHISKTELGCCLSHMWCLYNMLTNNYDNAIIFEDDVILSKKFLEGFLHTYEKNPELDFLMLGAHDYNFSKEHYKNLKNNLYKPNKNSRRVYGAHANFYSKAGARKMFYIRATNLSFFDNEYNLLFDSMPNSYICYPNLAISNVSESKIGHEKGFLSQHEVGYYNLCFINLKLSNYNVIYYNLLDISLIRNDDNTETFVHRCLYNKFKDNNKIELIKNRFSLDLFNIKEIKSILSNQSLIAPNSLSKKCIGEKS